MGFSEIIGHRQPLEILRRALRQGRLHHAYLFVGPEGVGKRTVALALAQALHCGEAGDDFCGRCADCARIQDRNHPDVRLVETLAGKKEIGIQQIRDVEKALNYRSFSGKRKIAIVDPATALNLSSQNALLKTLEEPPADSLLILLAANAGGLLPTLRSRCMRLSFAPLERDAVARFLTARKEVAPEEARFLAAMSMGSLGAALKLDQEELLERRRVWVGMMTSLTAGDYRGAGAAAEAIAGNKEEALRFLEWAGTWYRDLAVHAVTGNPEALVNVDMRAQIIAQSAAGNVERTLASFGEIARAVAGIQRNLNRRMVLEKFLFSVVGGR